MTLESTTSNLKHKPLTGVPLTELQPLEAPKYRNLTATSMLQQATASCRNPLPGGDTDAISRSAASIRFVRNRTFYSRAALNAKGRVTFGLRHIRRS